jgi:hypothetical protein
MIFCVAHALPSTTQHALAPSFHRIYVFIKEGELYVLALYVDDIIIVGPFIVVSSDVVQEL